MPASGLVATIVNHGALSAATYGITLGSGGIVTNGSASDIGATISAGMSGIVANAGAARVTNCGTIATDGAGRANAVALFDGGQVINGSVADTAASISGGLGGVYIFEPASQSGTVTNFGTISGATAPGVLLLGQREGHVKNGTTADTSATIRGMGDGVEMAFAGGTVTNRGTIVARYLANRHQCGRRPVRWRSGRERHARVDLRPEFRRLQRRCDGNGHQRGVIAAVGLSGVGVELEGVHAMGRAIVDNSGTISGAGGTAVLFGGGNDILVVEPTAIFHGNVVGSSDGSNAIEFRKGITTGTLTGLGTNFVNFDHLVIASGAHWSLAGTNTESSLTIADSGGLAVGGKLTVAQNLSISGAGSLIVPSSGGIEIGSAGSLKSGSVVIDQGAAMIGSGIILGQIIADGSVRAENGTLTLAANAHGLGGVAGSGSAEIDTGSTLVLLEATTVPSIKFLKGTHETLALSTPAKDSTTIAGFGITDTIDLIQIVAGGSFSGHALELRTPYGAKFSLNFAGRYKSSSFTIGTDHHGGTAITLQG